MNNSKKYLLTLAGLTLLYNINLNAMQQTTSDSGIFNETDMPDITQNPTSSSSSNPIINELRKNRKRQREGDEETMMNGEKRYKPAEDTSTNSTNRSNQNNSDFFTSTTESPSSSSTEPTSTEPSWFSKQYSRFKTFFYSKKSHSSYNQRPKHSIQFTRLPKSQKWRQKFGWR